MIKCAHEIFEAGAATGATAPAVICGTERMTYGELEARANQFAHCLRDLGVGQDELVGVLMTRRPEAVAAIYGTWKAGAGYLPLDPDLPAERLAYMLADCGVGVVLTEAALAGRLADGYAGKLVVADAATANALAGQPTSRVEQRPDPDAAAYVIYTSGSTGQPKGVLISHRALINLLRSMRAMFGDETAWLAASSLAFDISLIEVHLPLLTGGRVVLAPDGRDGTGLLELIGRYGVSHVQATPSGWKVLLAAGLEELPIIGLTGGEALPPVVATALRARVKRLVNAYGPTETTIYTHAGDVADDTIGADVVAIGRSIPNIRTYVLDPLLRPVPVGVTGEIYLGGVGLARGYVNQPALTADRFLPDPFGKVRGARLYRSGDLGRFRPDGTLECIGRTDHQVKVRGYRVELGEIEARMLAHPDVRDAAVTVRENQSGEKWLAGYVVAAEGRVLQPAELRAYLTALLPAYMVPAAIIALDAMPLNANGKTDRKALPDPERAALADREYIAPRTPAEERIAAAWRQALGIAQVGVEDSFFDLGGDSIRAVSLVGALRAAGLDVGVRDVFEHQTVARLTEMLAERETLVPAVSAVAPFALVSAADRALLPAGVSDAYPAAQAQVAMAVRAQLADEGNAYHIVSSFRIRDSEPLHAELLRAAVRLAVERHEALRTSFDMDHYSVPMQLVHETADVDIAVHEEPAAGTSVPGRFVAAERAVPFDLSEAPLLRASVQVADDGWWLTLSVSHLVTEGWSFNSLLMEILDSYARLRDGAEPAAAPPASVRYADFIAAELAALDSAEDQEYWRGILRGYPPFSAPSGWGDPSGTPRRSYRTRVAYHDLDDALRTLARTAGVPLKAVLHAAHLKVLSQLTDEPAFCAGLVTDARPEADGADRVHGMYVNTLPFAYRRGARTWRELVREVFDREVELWPHRRYPLPAIQRAAAEADVVTVIFNYQDYRQLDTGVVDLDATAGEGATEFALSVGTTGRNLSLVADTQVFSPGSAQRLAGMYRTVLEAMAASPDGDARATYLPVGERDRILTQWAGARREPVTISVPEQISLRAATAPDALALSADDPAMTYADLNASANKLAGYLRKLGVGPDVLVGIHAERSPELIVAVVAVLKAGGAYLPLDPDLPGARLRYLLADANLKLLLTRRHLVDSLSEHSARTVLLDDRDSWAAEPAADPEPAAGPDNLAYVIYTSGSTGQPKGVLVTRRGMGNHLLAKIEDLALSAADVIAQNASLSFDISVWQMLTALLTGGRVHVVGTPTALDPAGLFETAAQQRFTVLEVVPSLLRMALDAWDAGLPVPRLPALRWLVVTGETLPPELCRRWFARFPHVPAVNAYGPTECSDDVTHAFIDRDNESAGGRIPIGRPVRNTTLYVLDREQNLVPAGVAGEIYVAGPGLARGYLGRAALTAERFVPDPFGGAGS
ncbi:MAG: amino acid adenylation domain-containing protein, partial [Streptosporangiaceae bacterium]|nr:amino acid adenylation domain-containing protein [Streptosporangiaceae bacterium]